MPEKTFAVEWLETAPADSEILCILRHVSRSGMSRVIDLAVIDNGTIRYLRTAADDPRCGFRYDDKREGYKVSGAGMDMGFHLVYSLGRAFRGDGYTFRSRWI